MFDLSSVARSANTRQAEQELLRLTNRQVEVIRSDAIGEMVIYMGDDAYEVVATFNCNAVQDETPFVWRFAPLDKQKIVAVLIRAKTRDDLMYWTTYR